jgi:hypothetical protein
MAFVPSGDLALDDQFPWESEGEDDTEDSIFSREDSDNEHQVEYILAEKSRQINSQTVRIWYLVKWTNSLILESSWETREAIISEPDADKVLECWEVQKQREFAGLAEPYDLQQHNAALFRAERCKRQRRRLRRFRRHLIRVGQYMTAQ